MQANRWQILWHFKIPASLPYFYAGLRVSVSYAFITTVVPNGWAVLKAWVSI
jgi:permease